MRYDWVMVAAKLGEKLDLSGNDQDEIEKALKTAWKAGYERCSWKIMKVIKP